MLLCKEHARWVRTACAELDISPRTYQRWTREGAKGMKDGRNGARRAAPANKLSEEERGRSLAVVNSPEFASQPPGQIVPTLVDCGNTSRRNR